MFLLLRNLRYFRGVNIAVVIGMAVATAVLTGALMVGDSVRGSLADLARQRLGAVDVAMISTRFFDQGLAARLREGQGPGVAAITPAILIRGGAANEQSNLRTADVQIAAVAAPAKGEQPLATGDFPPVRGTCVINGELADAIGANVGASVLLSVPTQSDLPRDSALSRRSRSDTLATLRVTVARVERQNGFLSLFDPNGSQRARRNAWVNLADLHEMIDQEQRVNAIFVQLKSGTDDRSAASTLNDQLTQAARLEDYGLDIHPVGDNEASVFARETYIAPPIVDAALRAAQALHLHVRSVSVNLLNSVASASSSDLKTIHYAVASGIDQLDQGQLKADEIAINQWTADQLTAKVGDTLSIDFYLRQPDGNLTDASKVLPPASLKFTIKFILPMEGLGADPKLPPNYKGLTDAASVADWNPPEGLNIDKKLVTKADEDYWQKYRAAPKIFFNLDTAKKLWGGAYGGITGVRVPAADAQRFSDELLRQLKPQSLGMIFHPIKAEQLAAANGGTDFSEFFVMFSFFLIVAAALLVAMLFRLNVEQRARQLGLLGALGFAPAKLRRLSLAEGMILALIGGVIGLAGAIGYTWLIMAGLRTWWIGAVGTTAMRLYVLPLTLAYGLVGSLIVALIAILWAVWRVGKTSPARLLAGSWESAGATGRRRGSIWRWAGIALVLLGIVIVVIAVTGRISAEGGFGGGVAMLIGILFWLGGSLRPRRPGLSPSLGALGEGRGEGSVERPSRALAPTLALPRSTGGGDRGASPLVGTGPLLRLGIRNASRHTARGVLAVGLIGFAAFTLITVAAMRQNGVPDPDRRDSETGGYRLMLTADIPLLGDLNSVEGRRILGVRQPQAPAFNGVQFTSLRMWAGQDVSCLNLTRPNSPTILGIPQQMIQRGGFPQGSAITPAANPWTLLEYDQGDSIPVMADADTLEYVLKLSVGDDLPITDQLGIKRKLKIASTLSKSIFQGQLLMSDANFRRLFPAQNGFGMVLVETPKGATPESSRDLARLLASELDDYSVSVDTTADRLKAYQNVQNTYLSTFQTLGALGLMLGTLGLAVVLVRTVIERRAELALLASMGFTSAARVRLMLAENAFLLVIGLVAGAGCALIGIIPAVMTSSRSINAPALVGTLLAVLFIGLGASSIAVRVSGAHVTPADLRRE
ncbi:MAG TPA: FtsX-like permease family protein [Humisphaera sp.]|jgi:ABC-type lipoprotein release transport system permease subunit|nr:FtsX-like permease family protein [Humisphaera sp.]